MSSFTRPTAAELVRRVTSDVAARLRSELFRLRRIWIRPVSVAIALATDAMYGLAEWADRQLLPDTAEGARLDAWADVFDAPASARGTATFTGVVAAAVPIGTRVMRLDGLVYTTDAATVIGAGGSVTTAVTAEHVGDLYDCAVGEVLRTEGPVAQIDRAVTVVTLAGGSSLARRPSRRATSGNVLFTGTPATVIPIATVLTRDDGAGYSTFLAVTIAAGGTATARAYERDSAVTGTGGDLGAGATLSHTTIAGVDDDCVTVDGFAGYDAETDDELRARLLARVQDEPEGGVAMAGVRGGDFGTWAREALSTVRTVWVARGAYTERTVYFTVDGGPIPSAADVVTVNTYLQARRPLTVDLAVSAPGSSVITLTIELDPDGTLPVTDTLERRAAVTAELTSFLARRAGDRAADGTMTLLRTEFYAAISLGADVFTLTSIERNAVVQAGDVAITPSSVPVLGAITWA